MESNVLDPFGDYATLGYLRNRYKEKNLRTVGRLETAAFQSQVFQTIRTIRRRAALHYDDLLATHKSFFQTVYPWAGQDRSQNAPHIAIVKGGYNNLFAHPAAVRLAADRALLLARDGRTLRSRPGEVFGYLAHAHPFLEGNGRTILTVYADMCRRAGFHIAWHEIQKAPFLDELTEELLQPGTRFDKFLRAFVRDGALSPERTAVQLKMNFQPLPLSET